MKQYNQLNEKNIALLVLCSLMGLLFNVLFYNEILGVNYLLFIVAILICFIWLCHECNLSISIITAVCMLYIVILSSSYLMHGNLIIKSINFMVIPLGVMTFSLYSIVESVQIGSQIRQFAGSLGKIHLFGRSVLDFFNVKNNNLKNNSIIIGLLISIPLLLLIIPLMGSADEVFKYFIDNILIQLENIKLPDYLFQMIISIAVASFLFAYVVQLKATRQKEKEMVEHKKTLQSTKDKERLVSYITNMTILIVMSLIYSIFSLIQFKYLFFGNLASLPDFSYAEYARSGFFQMLLLTFINFTIIMFSRYNLTGTEGKGKIFSKSFMTVLILFNYVLIASSFYRMHLYESTFGYTMLRLIVYLALLLESLIMLVVLYGIWKENTPIIRWILVISITFYTLINLMSMDKFIAKKNIDRYFEIGIIDVHYLYQLSYPVFRPKTQKFHIWD